LALSPSEARLVRRSGHALPCGWHTSFQGTAATRFRQLPSNKSFKPNNNRYAIVVGLSLVLGLMTHVVVMTKDGITDARLAHALSGCVNGGIGHITKALSDGSPLFDGELFARPRAEQFAKVRRLLAILQDSQIEPIVFEDGRLINAHVLLNIMQSSDDSMAELDLLSDLGHEA